MADWGILQPTPNFALAALAGYQAGHTIGKQKRLDAALGSADLSRPETLLPILQADPTTGVALIGASTKLAEAQREASGRAALGNYLSALQPGQTPHAGAVQALMPGAPAIGASGVPAQANAGGVAAPATPTDANEITITAPKPPVADIQPDALTAARNSLIQADPDKFIEIQKNLATMDEAQRKKTDDAASAFAAVGQAASRLPYEQRRAYIQSQAGYLSEHGVTQDHINEFDPNDQNLFSVVSHVLGVKGELEQQDKDRSFAETQKQHSIENSMSQQRIGLEGADVGIARGHLALDQKKEAREAAGGSGGTGVVTRQLPGGVTAYRNPANGKWYDNPGFK